jgi:hypothetical protein
MRTQSIARLADGPEHRRIRLEQEGVRVETQGSLVSVAYRRPDRPPPAKRGTCRGFTEASRLRLMRRLARLDIPHGIRSTFATLTWRDEWGIPSYPVLTAARDAWVKARERDLGRPIAMIWRIEWMPRLTGVMRGCCLPHHHIIQYDVPWQSQERMRAEWRRANHEDDEAWIFLREIWGMTGIQAYVAKYVAKRESSGHLAYLSYLAKDQIGRPWGIRRPELLGWGERREWVIPDDEVCHDIRRMAKEEYAGVGDDTQIGYTVFGRRGANLAPRVRQKLDSRTPRR